LIEELHDLYSSPICDGYLARMRKKEKFIQCFGPEKYREHLEYLGVNGNLIIRNILKK
jgi:hypothetical protein